MLVYILKSSVCLAIFMIFYKLILEKTSVHKFKRFYLLFVLCLAFTIPLITFTEYVEPIAVELQMVSQTDSMVINDPIFIEEKVNYLPMVISLIYGLGVLFFLIKFCVNLSQIINRIKNNNQFKTDSFIYVLIKNLVVPHTFFNYIFFNNHKFETNTIPEEVIIHEQTHAKQQHSIDIIILEILQILFWFNPLIYFIKNDIKLNHEFLADSAVLKHGIEPSTYKNIILAFSSKATSHQLANAINYSSIKKRFTVMKTQTSKTSILFRSLLLLPLIVFTLFSFSNKKEVEKQMPTETARIESIDLYFNEKGELFHENEPYTFQQLKILFEQNNDLHVSIKCVPDVDPELSKGLTLKIREIGIKKITVCTSRLAEFEIKKENPATPEQLTEYNKLAKQYNAQPQDKRIIKRKDLERLELLYGLMSEEQKKNATPFPECPPPPAPPAPPVKDNLIKTGFAKINGSKHFFVKRDNHTKFYNRNGFEVSKTGKILSDSRINASDIIPNQYITKVYSDGNVMAEFVDNKPNSGLNNIDIPTPATPIPQLDYVIDMAKKNAIFYNEDKLISSDEAIALFKKNKELNISIKHIDSQQPKVYITKDPIQL